LVSWSALVLVDGLVLYENIFGAGNLYQYRDIKNEELVEKFWGIPRPIGDQFKKKGFLSRADQIRLFIM